MNERDYLHQLAGCNDEIVGLRARALAAEAELASVREQRDAAKNALVDVILERKAAEARVAQLEAALREYAPSLRMDAWHKEECWIDPEDWFYEEWLEKTDSYTPDTPYEERRAAFNAWWSKQPEPTDAELCDEGCPYPRARALLASQPLPEEPCPTCAPAGITCNGERVWSQSIGDDQTHPCPNAARDDSRASQPLPPAQ